MLKKGELTIRYIIILALAVMVLVVVVIVFRNQIGVFIEKIQGIMGSIFSGLEGTGYE
ncbi:hypothetical protein HOC80_04420 [archaeon]|jgi:hypothetical protein|nr:hypothetical protein [archaeon]MBT4417318.1 hypothetical protein [archaeon]